MGDKYSTAVLLHQKPTLALLFTVGFPFFRNGGGLVSIIVDMRSPNEVAVMSGGGEVAKIIAKETPKSSSDAAKESTTYRSSCFLRLVSACTVDAGAAIGVNPESPEGKEVTLAPVFSFLK